MKKRLNCFAVLFAIGGSAYGAIEVLWRGHTHWSMIITGGTCFAALYRIMIKTVSCSMTLRCCIGSAVITFFEFISGFLFNHCLIRLSVQSLSQAECLGLFRPPLQFLRSDLPLVQSALGASDDPCRKGVQCDP